MPKFVIPSIFEAIDKLSGPVKAMANKVRSFSSTSVEAMANSERSFRKLGGAADGIFNKFVNLRNGIIAIGSAIGLSRVIDWVGGIAEAGDELAETSKRIGVSTTMLQELRYASKLHNIDNETLTKSFEKLNKNLGDMKHNQGALQSALKKSSPAFLKQLKGAKDTGAAFELVIDHLGKLPTAADKASFATAAFGKAGQDMINLVGDGPAALAALRAEAHKYGAVLSEETIAAAANFGDQQDRMNTVFGGLANIVGGQLMPLVIEYMGKLTNWIVANKDLIKTKVSEWVGKLSNMIGWLAENFDKVMTGVKLFIGWLLFLRVVSLWAALSMFGLQVATLLKSKADREAILTQWGLNKAMLASPIPWIILGIMILIGVLIWVASTTEGWGETWDSVVNWMGNVFAAFKLDLLLKFKLIEAGFMLMVDALVIAWKWGQNLIGNLSDEQYAKDIARIKAEQKARVDSIRETSKALALANKAAEQTPEWKVKWKDDPKDKSIFSQMGDFSMPDMNGAGAMPVMDANAERNNVLKQDITTTQKQQLEIILSGQQADNAKVGKNTGDIPIKLTPTIAGFGGGFGQ